MAVGPDPVSGAVTAFVTHHPFEAALQTPSRGRWRQRRCHRGAQLDESTEGQCEPPAGTLPDARQRVSRLSTSGYLVSSFTWFDESALVGENDRLHPVA